MATITVEVEAKVTYTCYLSQEDSEKVTAFIGDKYISAEEAIMELYNRNEIDLYHNSTESDFSTEEILQAYEED